MAVFCNGYKSIGFPLSNLDLTIPPVSVSVFLCYKKPTNRSESSFSEEATHDLKSSLSEALVYYYVLAGEMVANSSGEPNCFATTRVLNSFKLVRT
jgi:hypothetical protein